MKVLCTFSGKYGDILWSLPTARQIAKDIAGEPVDFAMMPYYESLCLFVEAQEYIDKCFVIPDWIRTHSNHGDGPWEAPTVMRLDQEEGTIGKVDIRETPYDKVFHLTYKGHPGINAPSMSLIDFVAYQQGIKLEHPVVPFLTAEPWGRSSSLMIALAFNEQYAGEKKQFELALTKASGLSDIQFCYPAGFSWESAAGLIEASDLFIGCRSANWVIAMGLGKSTITYEPHPSRHAQGHLGKIFGCPYGREYPLPFMMPPAVAAETAAGMIKKKLEEVKETVG